jgi:hypothetical protein
MQPIVVKKKKSVAPLLKGHAKATEKLMGAAAREIKDLNFRLAREKDDCAFLMKMISEIDSMLSSSSPNEIRGFIMSSMYFFKVPVVELEEEEFEEFQKR